MRVLLVAPFNSFKYRTRRFDFFGWRLVNGFIRNDHFVNIFSDRDSMKDALGIKPVGQMLASRRLVEIASYFRPDLLCLHTYEHFSDETIWRVKNTVPGCKVAIVECDSLFNERFAVRFDTILKNADFGFATTGGATLATFARNCPVAFIPNLVDTSIDNVQAFAEADKVSDVFCACGNTGPADRWRLIDDLREQWPSLKYSLHYRGKRNPLFGDALVDAVRTSKIGLNVNQFEGDLYASDRMAQYIGNGLLLATFRSSGFARYFNDDEMIFFDDARDLGQQIERAVSDDALWRAMAERGYRKALSIMDGAKVTDFIVKMTKGQEMPKDWAFTEEIYRSNAGY